MDKKQFERIITDLTEDWLYDTVEPIRGTFKRANGTKSTPGRRTTHDGEEREANPTGSVQIVKWEPRTSYCRRCDREVENQEEEINVVKRTVKCLTCKQKYSIDLLNPFR